MIIILLLILFKTCSNDESETGDALTVSSAETVTAITDSGSEEIPASEKSDEEELSAVSEMATSNEEDEIRESLSIAGIAVNIDSKDGSTVISYPEGISDEEVEAFLDDELEKYALVGIVSYEITEDGVVITYPEDVDEEARAEAIAILTEDLASYVNEKEEVAEESAVAEEKAAEEIYPLIAVITAKDISSDVESYAEDYYSRLKREWTAGVREEALAEGLIRGKAEGLAKGKAEGRAEGRRDFVRVLLKESSAKDVSNKFGIPLAEVKEMIARSMKA